MGELRILVRCQGNVRSLNIFDKDYKFLYLSLLSGYSNGHWPAAKSFWVMTVMTKKMMAKMAMAEV